jgi:acetyl-CoA carboxylase biotin carboxyl carrier protein
MVLANIAWPIGQRLSERFQTSTKKRLRGQTNPKPQIVRKKKMTKIDIISPVTGSVWKIECSKGQKVAEGDILMILESMKMEIPVTAPTSGTVDHLSVEEGAAVDEDAIVGAIVS